MARGQRKTIDEKIQQQQHMISALESKLKHANEELEALISKKKTQEVEILYDYIKEADLSVHEATEVLQQYLSGQCQGTV